MSEETEHGEHRGAEEEVHGGSVEGAGDGAGTGSPAAADPVTIVTDSAGNIAVENTGDSPVIWKSPAGQLVHLAPKSGIYWVSTSSFANGGAVYPAGLPWAPFPPPLGEYPAPPPLADEGVKVGEIEAWRAWRVNGESLQSLVMENFWNPGTPMEGNPDHMPQGVYAFKTKALLQQDLPFACQDDPEVLVTARRRGADWCNHIYGRVALWGRIVEHDYGYRAEYAKVLSLEGGPCGREKLVELCRIYGLPDPPPLPPAKRSRGLAVWGTANAIVTAWDMAYANAMFALGRPWLWALGVVLALMSGTMAWVLLSRRR